MEYEHPSKRTNGWPVWLPSVGGMVPPDWPLLRYGERCACTETVPLLKQTVNARGAPPRFEGRVGSFACTAFPLAPNLLNLEGHGRDPYIEWAVVQPK